MTAESTRYRVMANGLVFRIDCSNRRRFLGFTWWSQWWTPAAYVRGTLRRQNYFETIEAAQAQVGIWRDRDVRQQRGWTP